MIARILASPSARRRVWLFALGVSATFLTSGWDFRSDQREILVQLHEGTDTGSVRVARAQLCCSHFIKRRSNSNGSGVPTKILGKSECSGLMR